MTRNGALDHGSRRKQCEFKVSDVVENKVLRAMEKGVIIAVLLMIYGNEPGLLIGLFDRR